MNEKMEVKFTATESKHSNCLCTCCHDTDKVLRLTIPESLYYDGKQLRTKHSQIWVCQKCREKLIDALGGQPEPKEVLPETLDMGISAIKAQQDRKTPYEEGYTAALSAIARRLHIDSKDIRIAHEILPKKADKLADRIRDTLCNSDIKTPQPLTQQEIKDREGKPVWFMTKDGSDSRWRVLADHDHIGQHFTDEGFAPWNLHNISWAVFAQEGKEPTV